MIPGVIPKRPLVMGDGPKTAKIIIVGEAPGADEERAGKPFVGQAGELLSELLQKAGIPRSTVYITNTIKERPNEKNDISLFIDLSKKYVKHTEAYAKYVEFLRDEILRVRPNVVVAAGAVPLFALTGLRGITKYRGSILESTLIPGLKVIPVLHPAAALPHRTPLYKWFIQFDLLRVKEQGEFPWFDFKPREYILEPSYAAACEYLDACRAAGLVGFDIEVYGPEVSCVSFSYDSSHAICIPFVQSGGREYFSLPQEMDIWRRIASILEDHRIQKVGQNFTFDTTFLFRKYGIRTVEMHDTFVASSIIFPDFPRDLGFLTSLYSDIPFYKDEGKVHFNKGQVTTSKSFWLYSAKDSIVLMDIFPRQLEELKQLGNLETYHRQRALIPVLLYMTELGIKMDVEGLRKKSELVGRELDELEAEFRRIVGYDLNLRSTQQVMTYFYDVLELPAYNNRKTGNDTVDEGALKRIARKGHKEAGILLQYRELDKMKGTYYDMLLDDDNRLRCSMNPGKTETRRLASSATIYGTGGNMQNQPDEMKKFMLVDEGFVAYNIDLAQAENRIVAYAAPDAGMIDVFEHKKDLHSISASFIARAFGEPLTPQEIKELDKRKEPCPIGGGRLTWRYWGKKANHGFNYDQGYRAFAYQNEIPENEGKKIYEAYHSTYPGVKKYHSWVQEDLRHTRTITNLFGGKRRFFGRWGDEIFKPAYAYIPQSTVADKINLHGLEYIFYNPAAFRHVQILNQVHDSIVIQIPLSAGWEYHTRALCAIIASLETPLEFRGRTFVIPADVKMHTHNLKDGVEIKWPSIYENGGSRVIQTYAQYLEDQACHVS
jgi:uracil-DNA glycosylase family 4